MKTSTFKKVAGCKSVPGDHHTSTLEAQRNPAVTTDVIAQPRPPVPTPGAAPVWRINREDRRLGGAP